MEMELEIQMQSHTMRIRESNSHFPVFPSTSNCNVAVICAVPFCDLKKRF